MKIAIDAMGGDDAPKEIVLGAIEATEQFDCELVLVGDKEKINKVLATKPNWNRNKISIYHADEVIEMGEPPGAAVRRKKNSSIVVATRLVKTGECDAVLSAGSTGAAVAAALLGLGRISGIDRPTIATPLPNSEGITLLLDSGANVDSKPNQLKQSAIMGAIYAKYVFGIHNPKVGLLNIGEEPTKGNEQALSTYPLLQSLKTINFIGNVEGRDIPKGTVDVVVCDGFVGNIVLKFAEGLAKTMIDLLKDAIKNSNIFSKLAALVLKSSLKKLSKRVDYAEYGGAPLLGVDGCFIICHGSSKAKAIRSAVGITCNYIKNDVVQHIKDNVIKEADVENVKE